MDMKLCLILCMALFALSTGFLEGEDGKDGKVDNRIFELLTRRLPDTLELKKREFRDTGATDLNGLGGGGLWAERFSSTKFNGHRIDGVKK